MHAACSFLAALCCCAGLTLNARAPDTSFTVYSAYAKAVKTHPDIRIATTGPLHGLRVKRNISYCDRNGHALQLDVFYPAQKRYKQRPGVLLVHGGGWRSGDRTQQEPMAAALAERGYIAVDVSYRLSAEAPYPAAVHDLKAALRWMRAHGAAFGLDHRRIAILGCSAGGQLAALTGATNGIARFEDTACTPGPGSSVQAIIDVDGILAFLHPESGEGDERKGPSAATRWLGGTRETARERWEDASPLSHLSPGTPPVLFLNSGVARMHAGQDDAIHRLDSFKIYSEVHSFPDAPHPFWLFHPWFTPMMNYIVAFLNKVFYEK